VLGEGGLRQHHLLEGHARCVRAMGATLRSATLPTGDCGAW